MGLPLLSIIIPAYNAERFLHRLLTVLLGQILECMPNSIEVIIVNDGSQDATAEIAQRFVKQYSFIFLINQENRGECGARNTGIQHAKGQYIYFLDSDDTLPKATLPFFCNILSLYSGADIFIFGYEVRREGVGAKTVCAKAFHNRQLSAPALQKAFLSKKMPFCICSIIYRTRFLSEQGLSFPVGVKIGGDLVFMIESVAKAQRLYYNKRISFIYQIRDDSVMQGYKGYGRDRIRSFELVRDTVLRHFAGSSVCKKEAHFYIANTYLSNLVAYVRSSLKDTEISNIFLKNKYFLYKTIRGRFLNYTAICIARCIPVRFLFKALKRL